MIVAMPERAEPRFANGLLMLADISGYTAFLGRVTEAHPDLATGLAPVPPAYDFMVTLLDLVADEVQPTFRPVQTEGDAVFAVAEADVVTNRGRDVLGTIGSTYAAYHARIEEQQRMRGHDCEACVLIGSLELKFIVHAGTFVAQELSTRTHVAGPAVILAHRLLKNHVTEADGTARVCAAHRRRPRAPRVGYVAGRQPLRDVRRRERDQRPRLRACSVGDRDPGLVRALGAPATGSAGSRGPRCSCPDLAIGR